MVVDERFVVRIPDALDSDAAAPLLCAGITMYQPLRRWGAGPGKRVAIVGFGGLGHVGVKISHALGAHTTVLELTEDRRAQVEIVAADALDRAYDRLTAGDVRYRFVLDVATIA